LCLIINTDTQTIGNVDYMTLGVAAAHRAWVEKKDVLNTLPLDQLLRRLSR
jgi:DNA polymerase (family 10)